MENSNAKFKDELKKRAYLYAVSIIKLIEELDTKNLASSIIAKQLLRSATSVGANIIEAQAASSKRDFTNFLNYALKSVNESKFWICLLRDGGKLTAERVSGVLKETVELGNILAKSIMTLRGK